MNKKKFPDIVTKAFMFEAYLNQMPEKRIRKSINDIVISMGGNIYNRKLNDLAVIYFIEKHGLPKNYSPSSKIECQLKKLNFSRGNFGRYKRP